MSFLPQLDALTSSGAANRDTDHVTVKVFIEGRDVTAQPGGLVSLSVYKEYNKVPTARLLFEDDATGNRAFLKSNANIFIPGKQIDIQTGYSQREESIFKGVIVRHSVKALGGRPAILEIECKDAAVRMTLVRKCAYYYNMKDSDVIRQLVGNHTGMRPGTLSDTGYTREELVQYHCTDWDFAVMRADANGMCVRVSDGEMVVKKPEVAAAAKFSVQLGPAGSGIPIIEIEAEMDARTHFPSVKTGAWDFARQEVAESERRAGGASGSGLGGGIGGALAGAAGGAASGAGGGALATAATVVGAAVAVAGTAAAIAGGAGAAIGGGIALAGAGALAAGAASAGAAAAAAVGDAVGTLTEEGDGRRQFPEALYGQDGLRLYHGGDLDTRELDAWAAGKMNRGDLSQVRGRARILGIKVDPGDTIGLEGVGDRFNGNHLVSGVMHQVYGGTWHTDIQFGLGDKFFSETTNDPASPDAAGLLPGISGLHIGIVSKLDGDSQPGNHRIQVRIPYLAAGDSRRGTQSNGIWARLATLYAGNNRGFVFRPEVGDEVVLGFVNNDPNQAILLGSLHNNRSAAPIPATRDNFEKVFVAKEGMQLVFDDQQKSIVLKTQNGNTVTLSDQGQKIEIKDQNNNRLEMSSSGVTLESNTNITIRATGNVTIEGARIDLN